MPPNDDSAATMVAAYFERELGDSSATAFAPDLWGNYTSAQAAIKAGRTLRMAALSALWRGINALPSRMKTALLARWLGSYDFERLGDMEVKGKAEPVTAFRVLGARTEPGSLRGIAGLSSTLIGRGNELTTLQQAIQTVQRGQGQVVAIVGEAGLGKSRLLQEVRAGVGVGLSWSESRSLSYDSERPYGQIQPHLHAMCGTLPGAAPELLRQAIGAFAESFEPDARRLARSLEILLGLEPAASNVNLAGEALQKELFEMVERALRHSVAVAPAALVFDDLHWADSASIDLIGYLAERMQTVPLLLVLLMRPDHQTAAWRLKEQVKSNPDCRFTEIFLRPLTADQSNQLVETLLGLQDLPSTVRSLIQSRTDGNPFFIEETLRLLIDQGFIVRSGGQLWLNGAFVNPKGITLNS